MSIQNRFDFGYFLFLNLCTLLYKIINLNK